MSTDQQRKSLSDLPSPFIIADIGSNFKRHGDDNKNFECAKQHIKAAAACGVSAVKFQFFTHEELYGFPGDDTYALPEAFLSALAEEAKQQDIEFMCTAFSANGVRHVDQFVNFHKIASAEFLHRGILCAAVETGKPIILSTGGCTEKEIQQVCQYIAHQNAHERYALLECVAAYPADPCDYNLSVLNDWIAPDRVGISDHTLSNVVALTSIGLGATIFEKHFHEDSHGYQVKGPDTPHSIGIGPLHSYCKAIKTAFSALGDGIKQPAASEEEFVKWAKRKAGKDTFRRKP